MKKSWIIIIVAIVALIIGFLAAGTFGDLPRPIPIPKPKISPQPKPRPQVIPQDYHQVPKPLPPPHPIDEEDYE